MSDYTRFQAGQRFQPAYYKPSRKSKRIKADADVFDIAEAWAVDDPLAFSILKYVIRLGRKEGNTAAKDMTKIAECAQRWLELDAYRNAPPDDVAEIMASRPGRVER